MWAEIKSVDPAQLASSLDMYTVSKRGYITLKQIYTVYALYVEHGNLHLLNFFFLSNFLGRATFNGLIGDWKRKYLIFGLNLNPYSDHSSHLLSALSSAYVLW